MCLARLLDSLGDQSLPCFVLTRLTIGFVLAGVLQGSSSLVVRLTQRRSHPSRFCGVTLTVHTLSTVPLSSGIGKSLVKMESLVLGLDTKRSDD